MMLEPLFSDEALPGAQSIDSKYSFGNHGLSSPEQAKGAIAVKSYPNIAERLRPVTDDPAQLWAHTLRQIPLKQITNYGEVSPETVVSWRKGRTSPTYVKAMLLGRRVVQIRSAILETLGVTMPAREKVIGLLLCSLADIVAEGDEISAARARLALKDFADMQP